MKHTALASKFSKPTECLQLISIYDSLESLMVISGKGSTSCEQLGTELIKSIHSCKAVTFLPFLFGDILHGLMLDA
jgi:hypothetical protein